MDSWFICTMTISPMVPASNLGLKSKTLLEVLDAISTAKSTLFFRTIRSQMSTHSTIVEFGSFDPCSHSNHFWDSYSLDFFIKPLILWTLLQIRFKTIFSILVSYSLELQIISWYQIVLVLIVIFFFEVILSNLEINISLKFSSNNQSYPVNINTRPVSNFQAILLNIKPSWRLLNT